MKPIIVKSLSELDALVADKVMDKKPSIMHFASRDGGKSGVLFEGDGPYQVSRQEVIDFCKGTEFKVEKMECFPRYSQDIACAWRVVEKMKERDQGIILTMDNRKEYWRVDIFFVGTELHYFFKAETAPLTICLASLASFGIEVQLEIEQAVLKTGGME